MDRFFIDPAAITGDTASITGEDVAHITRVLRLQKGDVINLCDGRALEYIARIQGVGKQAVQVDLLEQYACTTEPAHHITLYQALPKTGKMEVIVQKCVELGVFAIVPVTTERCVVKPDGAFEKRQIRYRRVAYEAAKQSRRGIVPQVMPIAVLDGCDFSVHELILFAYEEERQVSLKQALRGTQARDIALIVGPEGGFSQSEAERIIARGAKAVSLGSRILRTETAGMSMLAMVLYELEG